MWAPSLENNGGLRHGDPISPLMFDIASYALTKMFDMARDAGHIKGVVSHLIPQGILQLQCAENTMLLCIEMDCTNVASILKSKDDDRSVLFPLTNDARFLMLNFKEVSVSTVKRNRNKLAHELAAYARRSGDITCVAVVPPDLREILAKDCNLARGAM